MPVATTSGSATQRYELKTALPDGFVVVRRMTYGEYLSRRERVSRMYLESSDGEGMKGSMQLVSFAATAMDFANCIVEHNLTDEDGNLLDFKKPDHIRSLDPRIGDEVGSYIDEMNQFTPNDEGN